MRLSWKWVLAVLLVGAAVLLWCLAGSKYGLEVSNYVLSTPKLTQPVRVVQLSDLHNQEFGPENARLVNLVRKQNPDLILLTGDMLNSDEERTDVVTNLITRLTQIAPVYASWGNHEGAYVQAYYGEIEDLYERAGAVCLEQSHEDVTVNGQTIRIGGILGYCLADRYLRTGEARPHELAFLKEFQDTEHFTMLLCHYSLCWIVNDNLEQWDIDTIFSGHSHGGQVRLPIVGGMYAPDAGLFPGQERGLYYSRDGKRVMVLSRGLGSSGSVPRFNNVPEVVVVDILPQKR